jgi:hypothetical protein
MADTTTGMPAHTPTEQTVGVNPGGDGKPLSIDAHGLLQLLEAHATKIGAALGHVIVEKLAALKHPPAEAVRAGPAVGGPHESLERVEQALAGAEDAWLAKHPADDRAQLKCTDRELRDLEKTLEGPQKLLEEEQGDTRPPVGKIGAWQLPEYQPVPPDVIATEQCEPAPTAGGG